MYFFNIDFEQDNLETEDIYVDMNETNTSNNVENNRGNEFNTYKKTNFN